MNIRQIRELAQIVRENGLSALEISENDNKIRIECARGEVVVAAPAPAAVQVSEAPAPVVREEAAVDFNRVHEIKSPMVGVFYTAPAENAEPFVSVGDRIRQGQTLCIIEAMKLMNEIPAECAGEVTEVCVKNGQAVDYGCALFRIRR